MADATKAMQQLHGLDIGGTAISVKIAAIAPTDMAGLAGMNMPTLDDDEGMAFPCVLHHSAAHPRMI